MREERKVNDAGFIPPLEKRLSEGDRLRVWTNCRFKVIDDNVQDVQDVQAKIPLRQNCNFTLRENMGGQVGQAGQNENNFEDYNKLIKNYNGIYLAKMEEFRKSTKTYANTGEDIQRFVSFADMELLRRWGE